MTTISKKVCLLGDFAVGKTSLVRRFVHNRFDDKYLSTIGVKVSRKTLAVPQGDQFVELTMMLWDVGSSEEFKRMRPSYLRGAAGALLVGDLTRPDTFETLRGYAADLFDSSPQARCVLAANKRDLIDSQQPNPAQMQRVAADLNAALHVTSAKTGEQVENAFRYLGRLLVS